jgi:D-alanyl-D-alanine carboxypeptidase
MLSSSLARTRRASSALAVAAVLLAGCAVPAPQPTTPPSPSASETPATGLAEAFAAQLEQAGVPGGVLAVRTGDETLSFPVGVADAEGTPVSEETLFAYRSITKSFVVTALLQLAGDAALDLDAPSPAPVPGVPDTATLRQLAAMVSGVPNYSAQPGLATAISAEPDRSFTDDDLFALVEGLGEVFAPGTGYEYSNTNTLLIGRAIESATGQPWADVVLERVAGPLLLDSVTYPGDAPEPPEDAASPFQLDTDGAPPEALPWVRASAFSAAGGLWGTASDLAAWAEALGTGALLRPETFEQRLAAFGPTTADPQSPYYDAYGLGIGRIGDWIGHTGNGLGYQALAMHDPASGISVAIVLNATGADGDLPAHMLEALEPEILAG